MLRNIFSNLPKGPLSVMVLAWGAVDCTNGDATDGEAGLVPGFEGAGWGVGTAGETGGGVVGAAEVGASPDESDIGNGLIGVDCIIAIS